MDESMTVSRVRRTRRSLAEKRSIVEQSLAPGACIAEIARQRGINDNLIFNWRKLYLSGRLGEVSLKSGSLLPVKVTDAGQVAASVTSDHGAISIQLSKARIRIEGRADANTLAVVLERLLR